MSSFYIRTMQDQKGNKIKVLLPKKPKSGAKRNNLANYTPTIALLAVNLFLFLQIIVF